jgi:hypothetical protein
MVGKRVFLGLDFGWIGTDKIVDWNERKNPVIMAKRKTLILRFSREEVESEVQNTSLDPDQRFSSAKNDFGKMRRQADKVPRLISP